MTQDEKYQKALRAYEELMRTPLGPAKPAVDIVRLQLTRAFAQKVRAYPKEVRVLVRDPEDRTTSFEVPLLMT
jgi:hypothetical protein